MTCPSRRSTAARRWRLRRCGAAWLGAQVEGYFSQRILRLVGEIQKHLRAGKRASGAQHAFPTPPGAHLSKDLRGGPALAFVRRALRGSVAGRVRGGGRRALAEKRPQAPSRSRVRAPGGNSANRASRSSFATPCAACCGECRDLDLCRDERVVEDGRWDCATCGNPYDAQWIEYARRARQRASPAPRSSRT